MPSRNSPKLGEDGCSIGGSEWSEREIDKIEDCAVSIWRRRQGEGRLRRSKEVDHRVCKCTSSFVGSMVR